MRGLPPWTCLDEGKFVALSSGKGCGFGYYCAEGVAEAAPEKWGEQAGSPPRASPRLRDRSTRTELQNLGFLVSVGKPSSLLPPNFALFEKKKNLSAGRFLLDLVIFLVALL